MVQIAGNAATDVADRLEKIAEWVRAYGDASVVYLVPDRDTLAARRQLYFALIAPEQPRDVPFQTMGTWMARLSRRLGLTHRRLKPWEQSLLLRRCLAAQTPTIDDPLFGIWDKPGTLRSLVPFLVELRGEGSERSETLPPVVRRALIAYEEMLTQHNLADEARVFQDLTQRLQEAKALHLQAVVSEGFWEWSAWERALLRAVEPHCHHMELYVPHDASRPELYPDLDGLSRELGSLWPHCILYDPDVSGTFVARQLFRPESPTVQSSGDKHPRVRVQETLDEGLQSDQVIHALKQAFQQGITPGECCLVLRSETQRETLLRELYYAGIPVASQDRARLAHTAVGRTFIYLLKVWIDPRPEHMAAVVQSPYVRGASVLRLLPQYVPDRLSGEAIEKMLHHVGASLRFRRSGEGHLRWEPRVVLDRWLEDVESLQTAVGKLLHWIDDPAPTAQTLLSVLENLGVEAGLRSALEADGGRTPALMTDWLAWDRLQAFLEEEWNDVLDWSPEESRAATLHDLLDAVMDLTVPRLDVPAQLPLRPKAGRGVVVRRPEEMHSQSYSVVIIPYLLTGSYPRLPEAGWLSEMLDSSAARQGDIRRENRVFHRCVRTAQQELWLLYPQVAETGTAIPSPYLDEVPGAQREKVVELRPPATWRRAVEQTLLERGLALDPADPNLQQALHKSRSEKYPNAHLFATRGLPTPVFEAVAAAEEQRRGPTWGSWDGHLLHTPAQAPPDRISASYLNAYAMCPFRFFLERVMQMPESFVWTEAASAMQVGQLMHQVLEEYYREHAVGVALADPSVRLSQQRQYVEQRITARCEELRRGMQWVPEPWWEATARTVKQRIMGLLQAEEQLRARRGDAFLFPIKTEVPFRVPLVEMLSPLGWDPADVPETIVTGMIDRIDRTEQVEADTPDFSVVFDYKSSSVTPKVDAMAAGEDFQIPFYWMVAPLVSDLPVYGAGYISIREAKWNHGLYREDIVAYLGLTERNGMEEAAITEVLQAAGRYALKYLDDIARHYFPVRPRDPSRCAYCSFPSVCRYDEERIRGKVVRNEGGERT